jgi:superfamily II DNA/RNA helicase
LYHQFLHLKCYIFKGYDNEDEIPVGYGIIGSTNFTQRGMEGNSELNALEIEARDVISLDPQFKKNKSHLLWFNEKWADSVSWEKEFLLQVTQSKMGPDINVQEPNPEPKADDTIEPFTPYELYIKLLQLQFGDVVDKNLGQQIESYLPIDIHKLTYQIEAVKRCIGIMHEHGGFMLADVVGLGKTIVGTLIIKRFLSVPTDDGRERKVLIITPPAIQSAWKKTIAQFDKDSEEKISPFIDFITTGSVGKLVDVDDEVEEDDDGADTGEFGEDLQYKNYGLILIDESHKFRNSNTIMYQTLDDLIQRIGSEMGEYPYIGLLTATPQNNRPNDLKNQIYLFERNHNDSTLKKAEGGNLERFFTQVNREYDILISNRTAIPELERKNRLAELSKQIRDCVLNDILERRTRTDIKKYYEKDMQEQGIIFPRVIGPNTLDYYMDEELAQLFSDTTTIIAPTEEEKLKTDEWLRYYRYRAIEYFKDAKNAQKHAGRGNRNPDEVAKQLAKIMQILLVKRLESSFTAFKDSLLNLRTYTENMIKMWENDTIFICPQVNVNMELNIEYKKQKKGKTVTFQDCVADIRNKIEKLTKEGRNTRGQNAEYKRRDFRKEYIQHLREDYDLISSLYDRWANNSEDPKYDAFKDSLKNELFAPEINTSGKLVIFSEAIGTVESLARAVKARHHRPLIITAANRDDQEKAIEENFDANYQGEWKNDFDVIITTEVLAEGVNLHRANVILNYDTPWNSTRLMQRIGRVNRIGSKEPSIYVYNFMPSAQGDSQIKLVRKAHTKLQSFHTLFGEDNKIYTNDEDVYNYPIQQAADGEESPMQKYIYELKQYKEKHLLRYQQIEQAADDWQIAQAKSGTAYFIVKAPRSARLAISVNQVEGEAPKGVVLSMLDMLEEMKVPENAQRVPLPDNWKDLSDKAILTYNQHFVRINKSRAGDKATKAKGIISDLFKKNELSTKSKELLNRARKLVDKGSNDIIKKIIAIGAELEERKLFDLSQNDIDSILEREIGKLVTNVESKQGKPSILLGTIK